MEKTNKRINDIERQALEAVRREFVRIAKEKGMAIECIERQRMLPITLSILQRLHDLLTDIKIVAESIIESCKRLEKLMGLKGNDPRTMVAKAQVFKNVVEANRDHILTLINTYNNIIKDIKHHYSKKDKTVEYFKELKTPEDSAGLDDIVITMYREVKQIRSYMYRWLMPC